MRILYIPAENVEAKVSRSYFVARGFSEEHEVYRVHWYDNRNRFWQGRSPSSIYTFKCFIKSFFRLYSVKKANDFGYLVSSSIFLNAFIGKIIGNYFSIKLMRKHNHSTLKKIVDRIKPDIVYHADGFYFFPALDNIVPEFSDLQDDINWKNIPYRNLKEEYNYYSKQFSTTKKNFIVSENAAKSINRFIQAEFEPFDNGADFNTLQGASIDELNSFKQKHGIPSDKILISYIGGAHKFDKEFTQKLTKACLENLPKVHFLLVGNLTIIECDNVTNLGFLSVDDANKIYTISDIGITLKNTLNNDFLYNSVPLKFIQYGAVKKPIVTFPIKWSEENNFQNIFHVRNEDLNLWIITIKDVVEKFEWNDELNIKWSKYDWQNIADDVLTKIKNTLNTL